jgi:REP element-mobilizing transposase RayT
MARPLRVEFKHGGYHVSARGHNRQAVCLHARDRRHSLERLGEMSARHEVEVHAYVLMANHYHLLVRTPRANLSAALQWLNVAYSLWWNRRHDRVGHVFRGPFMWPGAARGWRCRLWAKPPAAVKRFEQRLGKDKALRRMTERLLADN